MIGNDRQSSSCYGIWVMADGVRADRLGLLLARNGQVTNARIREALGVTGLTTRHGMTLMHLSDGGPVSQQALIELVGVDPSVLVAILNDLEGHGLAQRRRDPTDRRRHIVEITPAGADMLITVDAAIAAVEHDLFADLAIDEVARLRELLGRIRITPDDPACAQQD
jgi:DNA-binding MarR family transcriptional regulator